MKDNLVDLSIAEGGFGNLTKSVLIKDMDLPKSCTECKFRNKNDNMCMISEHNVEYYSNGKIKPIFCELEEHFENNEPKIVNIERIGVDTIKITLFKNNKEESNPYRDYEVMQIYSFNNPCMDYISKIMNINYIFMGMELIRFKKIINGIID